MNTLFWYWIIGCMLVGFAYGYHKTKCPNDKETSSVELVALISIWPAPIFSMFTDRSNKKAECEVK